jgi:hypothetical protein
VKQQRQQQVQAGFMEALVREVAVKLPVFPADDLARVLLAVAAAGARPSQLWLQVLDWGVAGCVSKGCDWECYQGCDYGWAWLQRARLPSLVCGVSGSWKVDWVCVCAVCSAIGGCVCVHAHQPGHPHVLVVMTVHYCMHAPHCWRVPACAIPTLTFGTHLLY